MRVADIWGLRLLSLTFLALTLVCVVSEEYWAGVIAAITTLALVHVLIRLEGSEGENEDRK